MKALGVVLGIAVLLAGIAKKVAALEAKVETLAKRNSDLALKGRIISQLFGSPLHNFFASAEFWENSYDSGQADCAKRCIEELKTHNEACAKIDDATQREQCFTDALARASTCQIRCSQRFPPPIP